MKVISRDEAISQGFKTTLPVSCVNMGMHQKDTQSTKCVACARISKERLDKIRLRREEDLNKIHYIYRELLQRKRANQIQPIIKMC